MVLQIKKLLAQYCMNSFFNTAPWRARLRLHQLVSDLAEDAVPPVEILQMFEALGAGSKPFLGDEVLTQLKSLHDSEVYRIAHTRVRVSMIQWMFMTVCMVTMFFGVEFLESNSKAFDLAVEISTGVIGFSLLLLFGQRKVFFGLFLSCVSERVLHCGL